MLWNNCAKNAVTTHEEPAQRDSSVPGFKMLCHYTDGTWTRNAVSLYRYVGTAVHFVVMLNLDMTVRLVDTHKHTTCMRTSGHTTNICADAKTVYIACSHVICQPVFVMQLSVLSHGSRNNVLKHRSTYTFSHRKHTHTHT